MAALVNSENILGLVKDALETIFARDLGDTFLRLAGPRQTTFKTGNPLTVREAQLSHGTRPSGRTAYHVFVPPHMYEQVRRQVNEWPRDHDRNEDKGAGTGHSARMYPVI